MATSHGQSSACGATHAGAATARHTGVWITDIQKSTESGGDVAYLIAGRAVSTALVFAEH